MKKTFFNFDKNTIIIPAWYGILIPTWIKMVFPSNNEDNETYDFVLNNKSWVSTKMNLLVWAWVVDNEYRWEMHIHLINTSNKEIEVEAWQKITQGILRKLSTFDVEEISQEEFDKYSQTDRWEGWFGSTWSK
jgi:dUTPase